ncbi:MAG: hypothetical protein HY904_15280 [Deltaproteobacteria bacterium]|nr:hypothetical protein [Deltaproteobacteria bacterium]
METLGAFLLRGGMLSRDTLATALDRQVVYGGWLDTALLELSVADEASMAEVLARWAGYPVCGAGWLEQADPNAVAAIPGTLAASYLVAPFGVSAEGVWIATTAPVDVDGLAQLAASIGRPVLPHVTTEHRLRLVLRSQYGVEPDPRFDELQQALISRAQSRPPEPEPPPVPEAAPDAGGTVVVEPTAPFSGDVIMPSAAPAPAAPVPAPEPEKPAPPMDLVEALAHLTSAQDRDGIVDITLRFAAQTFACAAFLGVLRGQAVVWAARLRSAAAGEAPPGKGVRFPLDERSPLRTVVETRAPSLGKAEASSRPGASLPDRLGRGQPRSMLLQPILVSGRVVAVLYGDNGPQPIRTKQASDVLAFASRVGLAFENLIRERRARTLAAPVAEAPAAPEPAVETPAQQLAVTAAALHDALARTTDAGAVPAPEPPAVEAWVATGPGVAPAAEPPAVAREPTAEAWVVDRPGAVHEPPPPPAPPEPVAPPAPAPPTPFDDEPATANTQILFQPPAPALAANPFADEPLTANTQILFREPAAPHVPPGDTVAIPVTPVTPPDEGVAEAPVPADVSPAVVPAATPAPEAPPPPSEEPAVANSDMMFGPGAAAPPDEVPLEVGEVPPVERVEAVVVPPSSTMSPEAAALAARALARIRAGEDDDDEEEDGAEDAAKAAETRLGEDTTWNDAMSAALLAHSDAAPPAEAAAPAAPAGPAFKTAEGAGDWHAGITQAAEQAGTLQGPPVAYQPLPEDDEEEEPRRPGEEVVVFGEIGEPANASAFAAALKDTIESGKQGGESLEAGYKAFADQEQDDEDAEEKKPGWEAVVLEAAQQAEAQQLRDRSTPPPLPRRAPVHDEVPAVSPPANEWSEEAPVLEAPPVAPPEPLVDPPKAWTEALLSGEPERVSVAQQKLMELGEAALPALTGAFPGKVSWDPFGGEPNPPDPSTLSPLLDLLGRMGGLGLQVAVPHLDSRFPAHRYFATLLLARTYHPGSIPFLQRRLHDDEPRIRKLAGDALSAYVAEPAFDQVLRHLRTRVNSVVPEGRRRAIHFLGRFRDVGSIPAIIGSLRAKEPEIAGEAAQALHAITLQSYGTNEKKWIAWWEKNKMRSRIEWLIDALKDGDVEVRARAGAELASLTQDTFGFDADSPRRDRETAVKKWEKWWADERRKLAGG